MSETTRSLVSELMGMCKVIEAMYESSDEPLTYEVFEMISKKASEVKESLDTE